MAEMRTRKEHMQWAKKRALEYLHEPTQAIASMISDLGKHDETRSLVTDMGMIMLFEAQNATAHSAERFINGFAE